MSAQCRARACRRAGDARTRAYEPPFQPYYCKVRANQRGSKSVYRPGLLKGLHASLLTREPVLGSSLGVQAIIDSVAVSTTSMIRFVTLRMRLLWPAALSGTAHLPNSTLGTARLRLMRTR